MCKPELFIFDMDGLMFETGRISYKAYLKAAKQYDFEVSPNVYYVLTGSREDRIREDMKKIYGQEAPVDEWRESINKYKKDILLQQKRVYKKKGLVEILEFAKSNKIQLVLASSTSLEMINYYLSIEGLNGIFDSIVSGDQVTQSKPNPEIFLRACDSLGISREAAYIFEDSKAGVEAAKNANIKVCLIPDDITDLPVHFGKYRMDRNIVDNFKYPTANLMFENLLEAKKYFEKIVQ
ncbi:HAD family hydrolase [Enterococcus cecorum]|uniref:HAD family hydrolase n=1 Tax=Enterococcus cecorum TaxID=44008 RepID=UPI000DE8BD3F|nr:HAD family phosphatase [Enterococcus cecorum]RBR37066.1 hypothetical protein EB31_00721 [Enterococcus cecorum]